MNTMDFLDADVGTVVHKALLVHVIWEVMSLFIMGATYFRETGLVATNVGRRDKKTCSLESTALC